MEGVACRCVRAVRLMERDFFKMVLVQIGLILPIAVTALCHYHTVFIIPHTETNMHFWLQVIK